MKTGVFGMALIIILVPLSGCTALVDDDDNSNDTNDSNKIPVEYSDAILKISHGENNYEVKIKLNHTAAPFHVDNFRKHISRGNYNDSQFHRIIDNFMIQGGDFENNDGSGGYAADWYGICNGVETSVANCPEQTSWNVPDESNNGLRHNPCTISMAKTMQPNSGGSQFFIVPADSYPYHLDGVHTVFGEITQRCDAITELSEVSTDDRDKPIIPVIIYSTEISDIYIEFVDSEDELENEQDNCAQAGPGMDLSGIDFTGCDFKNLDLSYSDFTNSTLVETNLENTDFTGSTFFNVDFSYSKMEGTILDKINFSEINLDYVKGCASILPSEWQCFEVLFENFWADQVYTLFDGNQEYYDRINDLPYVDRENQFFTIIEENGISSDQINFPNYDDYNYFYLGPGCVLNSGNIYAIDASGINLSGCIFNNLNIYDSIFSSIKSISTSFEFVFIGNSDFSYSDFSNSRFYNVNIDNSDFSNIESTKGYVFFQSGAWSNVTMNNSRINSFYLYQIYLIDVSLIALDSNYADFIVFTENLTLIDIDVKRIYWHNYNNCSTIILDNGSACFDDIIIGPNFYSRYNYNLSGLDMSQLNLSGSKLSNVICPSKLPENWMCIQRSAYGDMEFNGIILNPSDNLSFLELSTTNLSNLNITSFDLSYTRAVNLVACPIMLPDEYYCLNNNIIGPNMNIIHANLSNLDLSEIDLYMLHARNLKACPLSLPDDYVCMAIPDDSGEYVILGPNMVLEHYKYSSDNFNISFAYSDMTNLNLTNMTIYNYDFTGTDFSNTILDGTSFRDCICPDGSLSYLQDNTCSNSLI